jgi:hypothetical protein
MTTLEDQLCAEATRQHATEVMLLAHVALDRGCLDGRTPPVLSRTSRRALEFLLDTPAEIPVSPEVCCLYYGEMADAMLEPIARMIDEAVSVTIGELSFLSRECVLRLCGCVRRDGLVEFTPAVSDAPPPWKRRRRSA